MVCSVLCTAVWLWCNPRIEEYWNSGFCYERAGWIHTKNVCVCDVVGGLRTIQISKTSNNSTTIVLVWFDSMRAESYHCLCQYGASRHSGTIALEENIFLYFTFPLLFYFFFCVLFFFSSASLSASSTSSPQAEWKTNRNGQQQHFFWWTSSGLTDWLTDWQEASSANYHLILTYLLTSHHNTHSTQTRTDETKASRSFFSADRKEALPVRLTWKHCYCSIIYCDT